jgi:hypothetical protein
MVQTAARVIRIDSPMRIGLPVLLKMRHPPLGAAGVSNGLVDLHPPLNCRHASTSV